MNNFKWLTLVAVAAFCFTLTAPKSQAQVGIGINIDQRCTVPMVTMTPRRMAALPMGNYGPEWFQGGVFIGAGPWFHGDEHFRGHVDNRFHPDHGYKGKMPERGEKADPKNRVDKMSHFKGSEMRDGRGHVAK